MKGAPRLLWVIPGVLLSAGLLKATLPQTEIGTWTSAVSLSQPRSNASAVMLSDGRVLITGGDDSSGPLQSAEIIATDGTTAPAAAMNVARSRHFAVSLSDGRVLAGGGVSSGGGTTNSAELYDPSADSWTQINPMTSARANATAALLQDGRVLIAGGENSGNPNNTIEIYDPSTGSFNFAGTLSAPRTKHAMAVLCDGRVLIVGGSDGTNALASSDIFDPSSGNTSAGPSLATARYGHSATTLLNGTVLVAGGATTGSNGAVELASAEEFDPATSGFNTVAANLSTARQGHQAFLLPNNNNVLIVGGTSGGQPVAASELFSPWLGAFTATGANVTPRGAAVGSAMKQDGLLLAAGGNDASGNALASTELYAFSTVKTDASDYAPGSIVTITGSGWRAGETVTLTLVESPLIDTHPTLTAIADGNGNISNNQFSPDDHDVNVRFYLTAVGSQSGLQAQNTFTDAKPNTVALNPGSFTVLPGSTATYTVTVNFNGNGNSCTSPLTLVFTAPAPVGATPSFSPSSLTSTGGNLNSALTITTTNSGPQGGRIQPGTYPFTVTAGSGTGCQAGTATTNGTLIVAGSATALSVTGYPSPTAAGTAQPFTVTALDSNGNTAIGYTGTAHFTSSDSQAVLPANYTFVAADKGIHSFSATVKTVGTQSITAADTLTSTITGTQSGIIVNAGATAKLLVAGYPSPITAGTTNSFTVTATDAFDNLTAGYTGTVHFTSSDGAATLPADYTFTTGNNKDNGTHAFNAILNAPGTQSITATDAGTASINGTQSAITVNAATLTTTTVVASSSNPSTYGGSVTFSAKIAPASGTSVPTGTVQFAIDSVNFGSPVTVSASGCTPTPDACATSSATTTLATGTRTVTATYTATGAFTGSSATLSGGQVVNPATLTASVIGNPTKAYNGTTNATLTSVNFSLSGLVGTDSFTVNQTAGTYNTKDVATAATVTASLSASNFTAGSGTLASNYNLPTSASGPGHITAVTLTASVIGTPSKPYDGNTNATLTSSNFSLSGLVGSDSFTITKTAGTYNSKDVAAATTATASLAGTDFTPGSGTSATNYTLPTTASGSGHITAVTLTASITSNPTKPYDGNTNATLTAANFSLSGLVSGESITVTQTAGAYNSQDVVSANLVTASLVAANFTAGTGTLLTNYVLPSTASGAGQISPKVLTGSIVGNPTKTYDGNTNATLTSANFSLTGLITGESFTVTKTSGTYNSKDVATATTVTVSLSASDFTAASGTLASNYTVPTTASGPGQITPKTLTASIIGNPSKTYDGTASATVTPANFSLSGLIAGESFTVNKGTGNYNSKDVTSATTVTVSLMAGDFTPGSSTLAGDYTLPTTASGPGQITVRPLTVSARGVDKQYDGTTVATVTLSDDRIAGDIFTDTETSASFVDKNVGTGKSVSVIGIAISGPDTSNYAPQNTTASTTANITQRPLTVNATGINKVYDGTTTATVNLADDHIAGDVFTDSYTGALFNNKNVANGKPVSVNGISISGTDAGNYILSNATASTTADITTRPLTITAAGVNRMYDETVTATVTLADNRVSGDIFTDNYASASFTDKTVGTAKPVGVNGISISGADAGNYTFNSTAAATADITARPLTVSASGVNKVYDGTTAAAVTLSDNRISGDMLTDSYASANFTDKNVANGKPVSVTGISISGPDGGNYALQNTTANASANITTRPLTVTAAGVNKEYDGTTTATVTLSDDRVSGDTLTTSYTSAAFADKGVANGKPVSVSGISISGADVGNYALQDATASTTANISPRPLTISAHGVDKQYDSTTTATVTLTDDRLAGDVFNDSYTTATFADKNVGNGKTVSVTGISISGADAGNYTFNTTVAANASITQRPITISAQGVDKQYDGTTNATVTLADDRLAGDVLTRSYASATFADKNVGNGKAVSVNGISISGADAGNYALQNTIASANANITTRPLTVNATGVNKQYDGNVNATVTLSDDHVAGDSLTDNYISASFADKSVANGKAVSVSGISISGADAGNYALLNATASTTANISLRSLTITAHGVDKQYDGMTSATVTLSDDRIAGDSITDSYTSASFIDKNAGSAKAVSASGISISGIDAGNYTFNTTASTTASINPRPITVTAVTDTKVYDGTTSSAGVPTVSAPGIATGDLANFSQAFDTKNAGPRILNPSGSVTDGNSGNNYAVTFMTASGTISQRPIATTADAKTKVYGDVDPPLTYHVTSGSLMTGDSFTGALARMTGENVGPYAIQQGTLTAGNNYALTYVGANLTITRAPLTITPDGGKTKIVGSVFTAFTGVVSGLKSNDAVTVTYTSTGAPAPAGAGSYDITVGSYNFTVGTASNYTITQNTTSNGLHVLYSTASCLGDYGHQILQPINFDGTSVFKQKSTVPAKFRVCDINGNSIGVAGVVSSFRLVQTTAGTIVSTVDESVDSTTPDAAFRWDPTAQQWIFNMNTKSLTANVTYYYTITLNDNSTITFMFGLK